MTDTTYNDWTNYATWRVNLEICDGLCASHLDNDRSFASVYELSESLKEDADLIVSGYEEFPESLALDYARAFLSDVNWYEIAKHWEEELIAQEEEAEFVDKTLRDTAAEWHGGQASPLYAFASTGTVIDGLAQEARTCLEAAANETDITNLEAIIALAS